MVPFLKQVARHYFAGPDIAETCFVFPNRRSLVFFRKYLGTCLAESGKGVPIPSPQLVTISDLFLQLGQMESSHRLRLLLELYDCYRKLNPAAEPLDDFVFWGDILLTDFDDVDKYLADPRDLFRNVSELKSMQDGFEYLSDTQRAAMEQFLQHFREGKQGGAKARFLQLWNLLEPLYARFREALQAKGMAYEGMVCRSIARRLKDGTPVADIVSAAYPEVRRFVFVGLNALSACERLLLLRLRDAGLAQFVWDWSSGLIRHPAGKASHFMRQNLQDFPQAFELDPEGLTTPQITVVSVPSSVGQAKLAPWILSQVAGDPVETAFVLPDERLLMPLLSAIPPEYDSVNVTMGYPMTGSALYTFITALGQMQLRLRQKDGAWYVYHRALEELCAASLLRELLSADEWEQLQAVRARAQYYVPLQDLQGGPMLQQLFQAVVRDPASASAAQNHALERYLSEVVSCVGRTLSADGGLLLELDFAKRCHLQLNILLETDLEVLPATHLRLMDRLLQGVSIPFRGEPLEGLQVMGPLETRALDFRYLVLLSANEGVFPRHDVHPSFIPPELRRAFGLPTHEYQDAVWAYYFYRMIQRPEHVWILYDSRTEGLRTGEESRYIKQLQYHFHVPMEQRVAAAALQEVPGADSLPKTEEDIRRIRETVLSASLLQSYLSCPASFYYQAVQGLKAPDEVAESLDAGMLGDVFHKVLQRLYKGQALVTPALLAQLQKDTEQLRRLIREEVLLKMRSLEVSGRNLVLENVILDYVLATLRHDAALLAREGSEGFRILGLELRKELDFGGFHFKGFIDRMDSYRPGEVRIVDYKTGKVEDADVFISDENALAVVDKLFGPTNAGRPKIALQLFLYDMFAHADPALQGQRIVNAVYSTGRLFTDPLPEVGESASFAAVMKGRLQGLLDQLVDPSVPFRLTQERESCQWCAFKNLCGR